MPSTPYLASSPASPVFDASGTLNITELAFPTLYPVHDRFATEADAKKAVEDAAFHDGYAVSGGRSKTEGSGDEKTVIKRWMKCSRSGEFSGQGVGLREGSTSKLRCPHSLQLVRRGKAPYYWTVEVKNDNHNHDATSDSMQGHASVRRATRVEAELIKTMTTAACPPKAIWAALHATNPNTLLTMRDIYNERYKQKIKQLAGRTTIEALLDDLATDPDWESDVQISSTGHITHLWLAHVNDLAQLRRFSDIILMDCTYKTNRFKMPLLNIVGCTNLNTTFEVGMIFLSAEKEEDYAWGLRAMANTLRKHSVRHPRVVLTDRELAIMKAIKETFPESVNIICRWHINKNIIKGCKLPGMSDKDWKPLLAAITDVWEAPTIEQFDAKWLEFMADSRWVRAAIYVEKNWYPHRKHFAAAWIDKYRHFGNTGKTPPLVESN
jgi:hypothetical protein